MENCLLGLKTEHLLILSATTTSVFRRSAQALESTRLE